MTATLTADQIGDMSTEEVHDRIQQASLAQLADMSRVAVAALPERSRQLRRDRLAGDDALWSAAKVIKAGGYPSRAAYNRLRNNYLNGQPQGPMTMIPPANEATADVKRPGDTGGRGSDQPLYRAGDVRRWLARWGRTDEDFFPTPGGRPKPGPGKLGPRMPKPADTDAG